MRTQSSYLKKKKKTVNSHSGQQLEMDLKKMTGKEPVIRKSVERPAHKREGWGKRRKGRGRGSQHLGDWETQPQINSATDKLTSEMVAVHVRAAAWGRPQTT